jgi:hypothetical protein
MGQAAEEVIRPPLGLPEASVLSCVLRGLPVYPRVDIAFFPSEASSYSVGGKSPFPPFVADGPFRDSEYRGYVTGG